MPNIWIVDSPEWYPDDTRVVRDVGDASRVQGGVVVLSGSSLSVTDMLLRVYFHHGDGVFPGASVDEQPATCVHFDGACVCGVQFHPEATEAGRTWLRQWIANALGGHSKNKLKLANTF